MGWGNQDGDIDEGRIQDRRNDKRESGWDGAIRMETSMKAESRPEEMPMELESDTEIS
jgi:hypothetical protein